MEHEISTRSCLFRGNLTYSSAIRYAERIAATVAVMSSNHRRRRKYFPLYDVDSLLDYSGRSTPGKIDFYAAVGVPRCDSRGLKGKDYTGSSVNNDARLPEKGVYPSASGCTGCSRARPRMGLQI